MRVELQGFLTLRKKERKKERKKKQRSIRVFENKYGSGKWSRIYNEKLTVCTLHIIKSEVEIGRPFSQNGRR